MSASLMPAPRAPSVVGVGASDDVVPRVDVVVRWVLVVVGARVEEVVRRVLVVVDVLEDVDDVVGWRVLVVGRRVVVVLDEDEVEVVVLDEVVVLGGVVVVVGRAVEEVEVLVLDGAVDEVVAGSTSDPDDVGVVPASSTWTRHVQVARPSGPSTATVTR